MFSKILSTALLSSCLAQEEETIDDEFYQEISNLVNCDYVTITHTGTGNLLTYVSDASSKYCKKVQVVDEFKQSNEYETYENKFTLNLIETGEI